VPSDVEALVLGIVDATRRDPNLRMGASPRASIGLVRAATVVAAAAGRDAVVVDDVLRLAAPVLAHRLVPTPDAIDDGDTADAAVERAVARASVSGSVGS
jgi:MoxR-like ATPase